MNKVLKTSNNIFPHLPELKSGQCFGVPVPHFWEQSPAQTSVFNVRSSFRAKRPSGAATDSQSQTVVAETVYRLLEIKPQPVLWLRCSACMGCTGSNPPVVVRWGQQDGEAFSRDEAGMILLF